MAHRPSDASGLYVIEILLTVHGDVPVCGMLSFFQNRLCSQLPAVVGNGFFFLSLFIVDGIALICLCVCGCVRACVSQRSTHPVCV